MLLVGMLLSFGRRTIEDSNKDYVYMAMSNPISTPNDHILLEDLPRKIKFFNIRTNEIYEQDLSHYSNNKSVGKLYDFYREFKKEELLKNPSS